MLVRHFCFYLTDWNGIEPRQEDYDTNKVVKALKGEQVKGYADILMGGANFRLEEKSRQEFLERLWSGLGKVFGAHLTTETALIPIPNSDATVGGPATYRTLEYARGLAASSSGKLRAVDALRWRAHEEPLHKQGGGFRDPMPRYNNLEVIERPSIPIILFDDVTTSGSTFIAACWRLEEAGNRPQEGLVIARATGVQESKMFGTAQRDLEIPPKPMF